MTSASKPKVFSSDVVRSLPLHYRALVQHLVNTGRAVVRDSSGNTEVSV